MNNYQPGQVYYSTKDENYPNNEGMVIQITEIEETRVYCETIVNNRKRRNCTLFEVDSAFSKSLTPYNIEPMQTKANWEDLF